MRQDDGEFDLELTIGLLRVHRDCQQGTAEGAAHSWAGH